MALNGGLICELLNGKRAVKGNVAGLLSRQFSEGTEENYKTLPSSQLVCELRSEPEIYQNAKASYPLDRDVHLETVNISRQTTETKTKLHGLSPRANYTDRATTACRRSDCQLLRIEGATWSVWRMAVFSVF
jgi:hypothetical protein